MCGCADVQISNLRLKKGNNWGYLPLKTGLKAGLNFYDHLF